MLMIAFLTAAYCASKGALVNFTRAVALDYADFKIHVNALCPGGMLFDVIQLSPPAYRLICFLQCRANSETTRFQFTAPQ